MNAVTPFLFEGEHMVRTVTVNGAPFFVANDVAAVLGYVRPDNAVARHCKKTVTCPLETGGQVRQVNVIPEPDLYRLVMRSKLPAAERFENWVVSEVLPTIRKTGGYGDKSGLDLPGQRHALVLIERLKKENSPTYRRALHDLLGKTMGGLGLETPPWEDIEQENPPPPDRLADFWCAVEDIRAKGIAINHARSLGLLAISLPDLRPHLTMPIDATLRTALKQSQSPRFVAIKAVNSALTGQAVKCWVFEGGLGSTASNFV